MKTVGKGRSVDFSRPISRGFHAVVMPLTKKSNMWYIVDPFQYQVWILLMSSIPIYLVTMGLADYFYRGFADWDALSGFVIRNVLSEQNFIYPNQARAYQKLLVIIWALAMLVLVQAYAGNLTAMLAKPKLQAPIRTLEELLGRDETEWVVPKGDSKELYLSTAPSGTLINSLYKRTTVVPQLSESENLCRCGCYALHPPLREKGIGAICTNTEIMQTIAVDFGETGKCNFYLIEDLIESSGMPMAFQVHHIYLAKMLYFHTLNFRKGALFWKISITFWTLVNRWG